MTMTAAAPPFVSYSINNEDVILNRVFGARAEGFFVDVGAAHPLYDNDTRALSDRGWRGINIEPTVGFYRELVAQRPRDINLNVAVSDVPGELVFHEVIGTGLSTGDTEEAARAVAKGFEVVRRTITARTLRDILQEAAAPAIDVLKVDVEGFELKVMQSNDWDRFRPRIILAEGTFPESPARRHDGVADYLAAQGYRHVYFDGLNDFYAEQGFTVPAEAFDRPPNVFDRFVSFAQQELARTGAALAAQVKGQEQELARREAANASLAEQVRRAGLAAEAQNVDLSHARAELIAMRTRGKALAQELDDAAMQLMLAQRDAQALGPAQARMAQQTAEINRLTHQLGDIYASSSWRITRPMRALARPRRSLALLLARLKREDETDGLLLK